MSTVVLDAVSAAKLKGAAGQAELFDENGRFVGMFFTAEEAVRLLCAEAEREYAAMTNEECRKDVEKNGVYTAEEGRQLLNEIRRQWEARK